MRVKRTHAVLAALATTSALALSACGGGSIENADKPAGGKDCGDLNMAVNPWVGYEADAYVVGYVAENKLGCTVNYKDLDEQVSWKGFGNGTVDVVIENWGHPELQKKYMTDQGGDGTAVDAGLTGNDGVIGWYVPPWMADKYPDITNWKNLNKYADLFKTPESGDLGTFYDGDPGFVTNDEALVKNLDLNYKVVYAGSETALIEGFRDAEQNKTPYIGYFYEPQWFLSEVPLVKVDLPKYTKAATRPDEGRLRLPAVPAEQGGREGLRRLRQPGVPAGEELHLDQRRPEPRGEVHRRGPDGPRGGRQEVGGRQPRQGRRLAQGHLTA